MIHKLHNSTDSPFFECSPAKQSMTCSTAIRSAHILSLFLIAARRRHYQTPDEIIKQCFDQLIVINGPSDISIIRARQALQPVMNLLGLQIYDELPDIMVSLFSFAYNICADAAGFETVAANLQQEFMVRINACPKEDYIDKGIFYASLNYLFGMLFVATCCFNGEALVRDRYRINAGLFINLTSSNSRVANLIIHSMPN